MSDAPPSYEEAAASSSHQARNGISPQQRRSMEDESRPLPEGWVRSYDPESHHQFFVDTKADPPRSIWHHPYDDEQYLSTLSPQERDHTFRLHKSVSLADMEAESSDDEGHHKSKAAAAAAAPSGKGKAPADPNAPTGMQKYTRRLKDKVTGTTHEQREQQRRKREEEERRIYAAHQAYRRAFSRALETGQPQLIGKDRSGRDVYIEPPSGPMAPRGAYGFNPYSQGMYASPNARYLRPAGQYSRPYGYGYGGGYGFPLLGGMMGGAMLGGLLF